MASQDGAVDFEQSCRRRRRRTGVQPGSYGGARPYFGGWRGQCLRMPRGWDTPRPSRPLLRRSPPLPRQPAIGAVASKSPHELPAAVSESDEAVRFAAGSESPSDRKGINPLVDGRFIGLLDAMPDALTDREWAGADYPSESASREAVRVPHCGIGRAAGRSARAGTVSGFAPRLARPTPEPARPTDGRGPGTVRPAQGRAGGPGRDQPQPAGDRTRARWSSRSVRDVTGGRKAEAQLRQMEAVPDAGRGDPGRHLHGRHGRGRQRTVRQPADRGAARVLPAGVAREPDPVVHANSTPTTGPGGTRSSPGPAPPGEPFRSVYRFVARDGRVVWVHGEAKVVRDDDGRPLFLQGVAFDITGMKQAEVDLKVAEPTLERRVAERTAVAEDRRRSWPGPTRPWTSSGTWSPTTCASRCGR